MASQATGSGTLSVGLVSIPVMLYPATSLRRTAFHLLHKACGARVKLRYYCPRDAELISHREVVKGYEHAQDQVVELTDEELAKLSSARLRRIDIAEFVPEASVDPVYIAGTLYLGPGSGGERAYRLLADAMQRARRAAVGRHGVPGREQLVVVRARHGGLAMHQVHYADEVLPIEELDYPRKAAFRSVENELADALVEQLSSDGFHPEKYRDEQRDRVTAAIEAKLAGRTIEAPAGQPQAQVIDLFEALKRSLADRGSRWAMPARRAPGAKAPGAAQPMPLMGPASTKPRTALKRPASTEPRPTLTKAGGGRRPSRTGTGAG